MEENKDIAETIFEALNRPVDQTINDHLIKNHGFTKIRRYASQKDEIDYDKFTCYLRIHELHYLFYSADFKMFTLRVKREKAKGEPGVKGQNVLWEGIMLPKAVYTIEQADILLKFFAE